MREEPKGAFVIAAPILLPSTLYCTLVAFAETEAETITVPETVAPDVGEVIEIVGGVAEEEEDDEELLEGLPALVKPVHPTWKMQATASAASPPGRPSIAMICGRFSRNPGPSLWTLRRAREMIRQRYSRFADRS